MATLENVLVEATKNNRVCPLPMHWDQLYKLLPNRRRKASGWEPALPLILGAWHDAPSLLKAMRLREHLKWAASQDVLDKVYAYMVSLQENDWYHYNE